MSLHYFLTNNNKDLQKQIEFKNFIVKNQKFSIKKRTQRLQIRNTRQITFVSTNDREIHHLKFPSLSPYDVNYQQVDKHQRIVQIKSDRQSSQQFTQESASTPSSRNETYIRERKRSLNLNEIKIRIPKLNLKMPSNYFDFEIQQPMSSKQVYHLFDNLKEKYQIKITKEV